MDYIEEEEKSIIAALLSDQLVEAKPMAQSHRIFKASLFLSNEEDNDAVGEDDVEAICLVGRSYFEGCVVFSTFLHCATAL